MSISFLAGHQISFPLLYWDQPLCGRLPMSRHSRLSPNNRQSLGYCVMGNIVFIVVCGIHIIRCYTYSSSRCRCDNTIFMLFSGLAELQFFRCDLLLPSTCAMCCKDTTINEWQQEISFTKIKRQVLKRGKSPTWFLLRLFVFRFFFFLAKLPHL